MKSRIFFSGMFVIFLIELTVLILFALPETKNLQDTVAVNEVVQTVQGNWDSLEDHINRQHLIILCLVRTDPFCIKQDRD